MRRMRLTMLLGFPVLALTIAAARSAVAHRSSPADDAVSQISQTPWTLASIGNRFEARQHNETALGPVPYDAVVLRRTLGAVSIDCGAFAKPSVTDNGASRVWTYTISRPGTGACATVTGASFVAVGRKGSAETLTPAVP